MFQDEACFGRMYEPRSCWTPSPQHPVVNLALIREVRYEYLNAHQTGIPQPKGNPSASAFIFSSILSFSPRYYLQAPQLLLFPLFFYSIRCFAP